MARFRQKALLVDAVRLKQKVTVKAWGGYLRGMPGDWLLTDIAGEHSLCLDDVFRATFEPVTPEAQDMMQED